MQSSPSWYADAGPGGSPGFYGTGPRPDSGGGSDSGSAAATGGAALAAGMAFGPWGVAAVAAFQLISGFQNAEVIRGQAALKKRINDRNADMLELDADHAEQEGFSGAARYQNVIDSTVSDQRTAEAANGTDVNYGTAAEITADTKVMGYQAVLDMQQQARNKAYGIKSQAIGVRIQGEYAQMQGNIDAAGAQAQGVANAANIGLTGYSRYGK